ncbi:MAG: flagellar biosynthetic protein FliR [Kofleriaceae bacterium]|nr:flagellar biosynthetic protein FliR [Kofleriaceae bacterium]
MTGLSLSEADLAGFVVVLARAAALAQTAPVIGDRSVPAPVRIVAALAMAAAGAAVRGPVDPARVPALIPLELAMGLLAGLTARLILLGAEVGGQLIGLQIGIGLAGQIDPASGDQALPTRRLLGALAGLAFLGAGGMEAIVRVVAAPTPHGLTLGALALEIPARAGEVLELAVRMAAPLIVAGMAVSLGVGLASRGVPSVNVFSVELVLRAAVALAVLTACAPTLIADVVGAARRAVDALGGFSP